MATPVEEPDTPFHVWMNTAVSEMQLAYDGRWGLRPVHLYRCFNAIIKAMEEVIKAHKE